MAIHTCEHNYADLANKIFPAYMREIECKLDKPVSLSQFSKEGCGVESILKELNFKSDFSGCYVLLCNKKPFYVGISRTVVQRLRNHVYGRTHFAATLAYRMATAVTGHRMTQAEAMKDHVFLEKFNAFRTALGRCEFAHIVIENPLERYLFEVFCAMQLNCCNWNSFDSH